jgi:hypothetical protein
MNRDRVVSPTESIFKIMEGSANIASQKGDLMTKLNSQTPQMTLFRKCRKSHRLKFGAGDLPLMLEIDGKQWRMTVDKSRIEYTFSSKNNEISH